MLFSFHSSCFVSLLLLQFFFFGVATDFKCANEMNAMAIIAKAIQEQLLNDISKIERS